MPRYSVPAFALAACVASVFATLVTTVSRPASAVSFGDNCTIKKGSSRWDVKTRADAWKGAATRITAIDVASLIVAKPIATKRSEKAFEATYLPDPVRLKAIGDDGSVSAVSLHEGDIVSTEAFLQAAYCKDDDSDFHIQISAHPNDPAHCVIVELPSAAYVRPNIKSAIAKLRGDIEMRLFAGDPPNGKVSPAHVRVTGPLFFDLHHLRADPSEDPGGGRGKKPCVAQSIWEIHPVVQLDFLN